MGGRKNTKTKVVKSKPMKGGRPFYESIPFDMSYTKADNF